MDGAEAMRADKGDARLPLCLGADSGGGVGEDEAAHEVEPFHREALGDHAADGEADHHRIFQPEMGDQPFGVEDQAAHFIGRGRAVAGAMAAQIEAEDAVLGQAGDQRLPDLVVQPEGVDQHQRRAGFRAVETGVQAQIGEVNQRHVRFLSFLPRFRRGFAMKKSIFLRRSR